MLGFQPDGEKTLEMLAESKNKTVRGGVRFLKFSGELERAEASECTPRTTEELSPEKLARGLIPLQAGKTTKPLFDTRHFSPLRPTSLPRACAGSDLG